MSGRRYVLDLVDAGDVAGEEPDPLSYWDDDAGVCEGCGCTGGRPCITPDGDCCVWAAPDLCSFCAVQGRR